MTLRSMTAEQRERGREAAKFARDRAADTPKLALESFRGMLDGQRDACAKRLAEMSSPCRMTYVRAMGGKSLKAAVKAFCMECVGWQREEVRLCTALACPLYPYRPFRQ